MCGDAKPAEAFHRSARYGRRRGVRIAVVCMTVSITRGTPRNVVGRYANGVVVWSS
jgi:hypothetical protein